MPEKNNVLSLVSEEEMFGVSNWENKIILVSESELNTKAAFVVPTQIQKDLIFKGLSDKTLRTYNFYIEKLLKHANKTADQITIIDVKNYIASIIGIVSSGSLNLIITSLKSYFPDLDWTIIPKYTIEKNIPDVLTKEEIKQLIAKTDNPKHRLLVKLLYSTGMRLSEVRNLKWEKVNFNENIIKIKGKGNKERFISIALSIKEDLIDYKKRSSSEYVFSMGENKMSERGIQDAIKTAAKNSGINKNIHTHTLRHCFATHLYESGVDVPKLQLLLGHSNLNTTMIYTHISNKQIKEIKSPLDQLNI